MKFEKMPVKIPTMKFNSEYFKCPRCGWTTPGPLKVLGNIAQCPCENCGHSYLVRIE